MSRRRAPWVAVVLVAALLAVVGGTRSGPAAAHGTTRPCALSDLAVRLVGVPGGAGHAGSRIVFRDRDARCEMEGFPRVSAVSSSGRTRFAFERRLVGYLGGVRRIAPVVLTRGRYASALIEGVVGRVRGGPPCVAFSSIRVSPPNAGGSVLLRAESLCEPQVHPVVAGTGGGVNGT